MQWNTSSVLSFCHTVMNPISFQEYIEYRNFELGVLFRSSSDSIYRVHSGNCPIHKASDVGILPIPYLLESEPFCDDDLQFVHQPYFRSRYKDNVIELLSDLFIFRLINTSDSHVWIYIKYF